MMGKCNCNPLYVLAALILMAVGLYGIVNGFLSQQAATVSYWYVIGWYFGGVTLLSFGKMFKMSAGMSCPVHGSAHRMK